MARCYTLLIALLLMQGCASLPESSVVAENPETLNQWRVEGELRLDHGDRQRDSYFYYQEIDGGYRLAVLLDEPVGEERATITGDLYDREAAPALKVADPAAAALARGLRHDVPVAKLGYWLRGLPAGADARLEEDDQGRLTGLEESGWTVRYHDFMTINDYRLPERVEVKKGETRLNLDMVRAETGYLTSPCAVGRAAAGDGEAPPTARDGADPVQRLVPPDGGAPLPRWIDGDDFCRQLRYVHGRVPDPRIGLYGPDSMMWKLSAPALPSAWGSGRALLLQTAHPWITRSIDEHSEVRDDPLGRARRTFQHVFTMMYGSMPQVMASANEVRAIHEEIEGAMTRDAGAFKKGGEYRANEVSAMIWVHATLWETLVRMYEEMEGPLSPEQKERFYQETKLFAMLFGIPEQALPADWEAFMAYNRAMWASEQLTVTEDTLQLKADLFEPRSIWMVVPLWAQEIISAKHLPPRIREQYAMNYGWWRKFNYAWLKGSAQLTELILPQTLTHNPAYHEANARLEGERVGPYQRRLIRMLLGTERLVN